MNQSANSTAIVPLPTVSEIEKAVVRLITPETADTDAEMLILIVGSIANFENPEQSDLAHAAMKAAFRQTSTYAFTLKTGYDTYLQTVSGKRNIRESTSLKTERIRTS